MQTEPVRKVIGEQLPFSEAVLVNPTVRLDRDETYPFVGMAAVNCRNLRSAYRHLRNVGFEEGAPIFQPRLTRLWHVLLICLENGAYSRVRYSCPTSVFRRRVHGFYLEFIGGYVGVQTFTDDAYCLLSDAVGSMVMRVVPSVR